MRCLRLLVVRDDPLVRRYERRELGSVRHILSESYADFPQLPGFGRSNDRVLEVDQRRIELRARGFDLRYEAALSDIDTAKIVDSNLSRLDRFINLRLCLAQPGQGLISLTH